jgi:hypothetical protein
MTSMRIIASAICLAVAGTTLVGCVPLGEPKDLGIAIRDSDGELEILVCREAEVSRVILSTRRQGDDWQRVWDQAVEMPLAVGDTLSSMDLADPSEVLRQPGLSAGTELEVIINTSSGLPFLGIFQIPDAGFSEAEWLFADGNMTSTGCEGYIGEHPN